MLFIWMADTSMMMLTKATLLGGHQVSLIQR